MVHIQRNAIATAQESGNIVTVIAHGTLQADLMMASVRFSNGKLPTIG